MIAGIVAQITENLQELIRIHERLLFLSREQAGALEGRDPQRVFELLQDIEIATLERSRAEERRSVLIGQAATLAGVDLEDVTVNLLARLAGIQGGAALEQAAQQLKPLVMELGQTVTRNRALIQHELGVLDHMVRGITVRRDMHPAYTRTGEKVDVPRMKILDAQV
jgi:hypothetical protein